VVGFDISVAGATRTKRQVASMKNRMGAALGITKPAIARKGCRVHKTIELRQIKGVTNSACK